MKEVVTEGQTGPRATVLTVLRATLGRWWSGQGRAAGAGGNTGSGSGSNTNNNGPRKVSGLFWFDPLLRLFLLLS